MEEEFLVSDNWSVVTPMVIFSQIFSLNNQVDSNGPVNTFKLHSFHNQLSISPNIRGIFQLLWTRYVVVYCHYELTVVG